MLTIWTSLCVFDCLVTQLLGEWHDKHCVRVSQDTERTRCGFPHRKLFSNRRFVIKHLHNKHSSEASDELQKVCSGSVPHTLLHTTLLCWGLPPRPALCRTLADEAPGHPHAEAAAPRRCHAATLSGGHE